MIAALIRWSAKNLVLILIERADRAEQRGMLGAQALGRRDDRLHETRNVRAADGDFSTCL